MHDVAIVGGGIFGQVIGKAFLKEGVDVVIIDDKRKGRGTDATGSLMKPSWFSGLGKEVYEPALETLSGMYNVRTLEFSVGGLKTAKVYYIAPKEIMKQEAPVISATAYSMKGEVVGTTKGDVEAKVIIVAAGIWCRKLLKVPELQGRSGVSFLAKGKIISQNFIKPWAPYKQVVGFNMEDMNSVWLGDGTSIKTENWSSERTDICFQRCCKNVASRGEIKPSDLSTIYGVRPYLKKPKPCLLEKRGKNLWLATGGAKNGTLAAGWCASKLLKAIF